MLQQNNIHIYVTDSWVLRAHPEINRQNVDRVLGFFSSRPNWDPPTPSSEGECVLPSLQQAWVQSHLAICGYDLVDRPENT